MEINQNMIRNILTLRYDPLIDIKKKKFSWEDFELKNYSNHLSRIEEIICDTIKTGVGNEKQVSVALSGGVDSTLVISLLRKIFPDIGIDAISVKFADSVDETNIATKIAENFNADYHIIPIDNFLEELPNAIGIFKMPFWDTHWYHVVKTAKQFSKILISGDGGDELFGGYTFRYEKFLSKLSDNMTPIEKAKLYLECHERDWVSDQKDLFGSKVNFIWDDIYSILVPYFDNKLPPINQIFLADMNGKLLFNWIPMNTSFFEYFDVKSLTPLLSKNLISFATHLDYNIKYNPDKNLGKIPLREILVKHVDPNFVTPKKQGFSVNTVNLWKSHGKKICDYYLSDARIVKDQWISEDWIKSHFKKLDNNLDVRYVNKFLGLLAFEVWYRIFVTKEMRPETKLKE
jgi:asparagine synthase (glutamine-hydrolysing)